MNLDIFNSPDPSGRFSKESFLLKNYPQEYAYILEYCNLNTIESLPFKEMVYLCLNNLKCVPKCKNPNCQNQVKFKNSTLGYLQYCSTKCISSDPNVKNLKEAKSIEKWGTKSPAQSDEIKNKIKKTNQQKWSGNSPMSSDIIKEKSKQTLKKNWGVDNPNKSDIISKKRIESFKQSNFKENFKKTSIKKWGVDHPWMHATIHKKTIDFFYKNYRQRINEKIDVNNFKFIDFQKGITTNLKFHCNTCNTDFDILPYQFYYRVNAKINICTNCFPISANASISQIEIYNFIKANYEGEIILDAKNIISPYEIDIYLPKINVGFEFNGVWWHSEKFKSNNYHLKKIEHSQSNNVKLFTVWEDDWITKREICQSFILNKLSQTKTKIFARKCQIKEVNYITSQNFLDNNHLQGDCKSSIRLGLFYNNELVSMMTFSKLRLPLQKLKVNRQREKYYELTRFCNKINHNIVGGASKILKYFIQKFNPNCIETYSDNLISNGRLYEKLGFTYMHTSNPGYWYVVDGIRSHRFNWRKQKLVQLGFNSTKSEEEIMSELGYWRIYNAGNKKWCLFFNRN
jgi:hypothetical protein